MEIRQAILKAADHIEHHPKDFLYSQNAIPECGTPGCAIGWVGHFLGMTSKDNADFGRVAIAIGVPASVFAFSDRMDRLHGGFVNWRHDAADCALTLRRYANKYHPADEGGQKDYVLPDWNALASEALPVAERRALTI